jgi:hypothetical protein
MISRSELGTIVKNRNENKTLTADGEEEEDWMAAEMSVGLSKYLYSSEKMRQCGENNIY